MSLKLFIALVLTALTVTGISAGYVYYNPTLSPNNWIYEGHEPTNWINGGVHTAPGPELGAGMVGMTLAAGVLYLIRRRSRS